MDKSDELEIFGSIGFPRRRREGQSAMEDGFKERMDNFGAPAAVWVNILKDL